MTTQEEFVKKESDKYVDTSETVEIDASSWQVVDKSFSDGLTKGLEIAKEAFKWAEPNGWHRHEVDGDTWFHFQTMEVKTTSELLTIFVTEKYGK